ncbi:MAG: hypothetical protein ACI4BB_03260 [Coprococcus sp.]
MKAKKMHKIIAVLLFSTLLVSAFFSAEGTAYAEEKSKTIYIDTAEDMADLAKSCTLDTWSQGKKVVLRADISLADIEFSGIPTFGGEFDGNGYTISGLDIKQGTTPAGLFGVLQEKAVIKNLTVSGTVTPGRDSDNVGGIAGENYGCISGCTFTGNVSGDNSVGGIAGSNTLTGQILNCSASGSVTGDKMTGGIVGSNLGNVDNCQNNAYVNTTSVDPAISPKELDIDFSLDLSKLSSVDTSMASSDTGGIAGYSSGLVVSCVNNAPVGYPHIGYNVGGIIGRSCGYIHNCVNNANVFGRKDVGGIAGQMEPYIAENISESALARLERQFEELDEMLDQALNDADESVGTVTSRLNRIAGYMDSAAGAAQNIRTTGSVTTTVNGSGEGSSSGSASASSSGGKVEGSSSSGGAAGAITTPVGGAAAGGVSSGGEISVSGSTGSVSGENKTSASGNLNASTQISMKTSLSGLSSALYGMSGQMRLLNGEISDSSGTLSEDLKEIQQQINAISDTAIELFQINGEEDDILIDSSDIDIDLVTLGKASNCTNGGGVEGDINVGGITGSMAMEYELDPEDDIASTLDEAQSRKLEVKAIIQKCVNNGKIAGKRDYVGGICGRMDLGLIARSEGYGSVTSENGDYVGGIAGLTASTIRHCFTKCTLSGVKNVGGIVGSGVEESLTRRSSTVAGCYSMVNIDDYQEFAGAVSGVNAGNFVENYFVSDTLAGINGRSYAGAAEPVSYDNYIKMGEITVSSVSESKEDEDSGEDNGKEDESEEKEVIAIPDEFRQLTLTFVADDEVLKTVTFKYGDSFDDTVYPDVPEKKGYYVHWDKNELSDLRFDTVVTAEYIPYVTALASKETRTDERPIFFIEGLFNDKSDADVMAQPNTPDEFDFLAKNWLDILDRGLSGSRADREIVEQWHISIPDDGQKKHTLRYLPPDMEPESLNIYVKQGDTWKQAEVSSVGGYLTFNVDGLKTEVAVISTVNVWWIWLLMGILLLFLLLLILRLIRKIVKAKRKLIAKKNMNEQESGGADNNTAESGKESKKKPLWKKILPVIILVIVVAGAALFFVLYHQMDSVKAYDLLKKYAEKQELSMELTVDANISAQSFNYTARADRTNVDGHQVDVITQEDRVLYYCEDAVFMENGKAYKLSAAFPDYSLLLSQAVELYRHVDIMEKDGTYTIMAENEDAKAVLELLMPSAADGLTDTGSISMELLADEDEPSEIHFIGNGILDDEENTTFSIDAVLKLDIEERNPVHIPEGVRNAIVSGEYEAAEEISGDFIRMANAWQKLNQKESLGAKMLLKADCGPVTLNEKLDFYSWNCDGVKISSIQKNGYALYFTDTEIYNKDGEEIETAEAINVEAGQLLDIAYQTCQYAHLQCQKTDEIYTYTISLDKAGIEAVAYAIAPAIEGMDVLFESGSIQIVTGGGEIQNVSFNCSGSVQVVFSAANVEIGAGLDFTEEIPEAQIPEAVKNALDQ